MRLSRLARLALFPGVVAVLALFTTTEAYSQKAKKPASLADSESLLKPQPRPKKAALPPSSLPLEFVKGERIAFVGNSTGERMNLYGHFETMLQTQFKDKNLVIRNFCRPADEVGNRQRSADYTKIDDPLYAFNADTFICFFGFNESFKGPEGLEKFKADYESFINEYTGKYPRDDEKSPPRFVLISPIAFEPTGDPLLPSGEKENANLKLYTAAAKEVAAKRKLAFVDIFTPTEAAFAKSKGLQFTINGAHVNETGDKEQAGALYTALFGANAKLPEMTSDFEKLRTAVNDKSWVHMQDYRMVNGWYVYGGRRTFDTDTFPREYVKIRNMASVRDQYVWDLANGKKVADKPDDSQTGELFVPPTRFGAPGRDYSENKELKYQAPEDFIKTATVPPGFEIKLFADESKFPEIAKPVQMNFDNKGRLWVSCMPSYPQWKPGDPRASDKLVILEDKDGDGKADKSTVFYDKLHCPTGFEFWNGGVLVMDQPRILFLKDTNGDDKADEVTYLLDGWATDDTHHRGGWEWSHGGLLHILEGIATSTTLETPWGPHRSAGAGGAYVFDPRTQKVRQFPLPGMANMWCYQFDEWGNGFPGDGTTPNQAWDTPLSGENYGQRKGLNFLFEGKGERPNLGSERLISRHLPDNVQNQYIYACVITMNGIPRFTIGDDGAGFKGHRIMKADGKTPDDLIRSADKHFRPADPHIGPDGALWFGDWANALIGHMQYSQRDPNRDHAHGRVYRLVAKDRPLLKPVTQFGKPVSELLEQLREYEWRSRYRARTELRDRPATEVLPVVKDWVAKLDPKDPIYDRLVCEALWIQQSFHAVDADLMAKALSAKTFNARAAATHILAEERDRVPGAFEHLKKQVVDEHPRVRAEALRGLSFYHTMESVEAMLAAAKMPLDYWTRYLLDASLAANERIWRPAYNSGTIAKENPNGWRAMVDVVAGAKAGGAAEPLLKTLLSQEPTPAEIRNKAMTALSQMKGNPTNGRAVFQRNCIACHKVGNGEGQDYGPNLDKVAMRLQRYKIVESLIDPNAEVDMKYLSTKVTTLDGKTVIGLLVGETKTELTIFDGKDRKVVKVADIDERKVLKQSSMPDGQVGTMAPVEFLDLIEYLATLK